MAALSVAKRTHTTGTRHYRAAWHCPERSGGHERERAASDDTTLPEDLSISTMCCSLPWRDTTSLNQCSYGVVVYPHISALHSEVM